MKHPRLATLAGLVCLVVCLAALPAVSAAQPKGAGAPPPPPPPAKPACGVSAIPLVVGNEWTYEPVPVPPDRELTDAQKRTTPTQPKKLVIKVTAIDPPKDKDTITTVSLSEDHDGRVHQTWIKCSAGGTTFQIAPDSFWFAGEAGPSYGIELSNIERKGQTLGLTGGKITALEWHDDLAATWKHVATGKARPTFKTGKLDLDRHWVAQPPESVQTKLGTWKALKLGIEITIKTTIEPMPPEPLKPVPLLVNFLWMVDGLGPVQMLNSFGQAFQLTATNLSVPASK